MIPAKPQLVTLFKRLGFGFLLCMGFAASHAVTSTGQFSVNIVLAGAGANSAQQSAPGVCISQTLSEKTNALVRVVCGTRQFVSITANPNARFLGTHGGAFNYVVTAGNRYSDPLQNSEVGASGFYPGTGTVTAWRIYNANGSEELLEVLLTF